MKWNDEENQELQMQFLMGLSKVVLRPTMAKLTGLSAEAVRSRQFLKETQFDLNFKRTRGRQKTWSIKEPLVRSHFGYVAALMVAFHTDFSEVSTVAAAVTAYSQALQTHLKQIGKQEITFTDYELVAACVIVYLMPHHHFAPIESWFEDAIDEIDSLAEMASVEIPPDCVLRIDLVELVQDVERRLDITTCFDTGIIKARN